MMGIAGALLFIVGLASGSPGLAVIGFILFNCARPIPFIAVASTNFKKR